VPAELGSIITGQYGFQTYICGTTTEEHATRAGTAPSSRCHDFLGAG